MTVVPAPGPGVTAFEAASQRASGRRALSAAERRWEWIESRLSLAAQGAVGIAAGALLLSLPTPSLRTFGIIIGVALVVNLLGIYFLAIGSLRLARAVAAHRTAPAGDTR